MASDEVKGMKVDDLLQLDRDFVLDLLGIDISRDAHEVRAAVAEGAQERRRSASAVDWEPGDAAVRGRTGAATPGVPT